MIIPIFIPHEGCPNDCAFCNQRTISGKNSAPTTEEIEKIIENHLATMGKKARQIAFFGGSFTGIEKIKQQRYLSVAEKYIKTGKINGIRISTRPDYIDKDTVNMLEAYGVTNIELGAQSMDEEVLFLSKRGHSARDVEKASEIINSSSVCLGLQMMTGLPGDTPEKCLYTAKKFKELGARETRIYPTVILRGTHLEKMYNEGAYIPHTVEDAVEICAKLYRYFTDNNIEILRMGLADSVELKENFVQGAYHPSIGEMIVSRDIRNSVEKSLGEAKNITIHVNRKYISKVTGNKKCNLIYFKQNGINVKLVSDDTVDTMKITEVF